ncbi:hypothetical protein ACFYSW_28770 [Rhodococcus aetherivorans]|uniref:hypothetical protein n=1 Tax=Rhodococcus aetherivorans TaxID=191292 RepID=UPI00369CE73B
MMLGSRAARWPKSHPGQQLIITVSVPARGFAAALIGCGWMMASAAPELPPVQEVAASLPAGTPVRVVTNSKIIAEQFRGVDIARGRLILSGGSWQLDKVRAMTALPGLDEPRRQPLPEPGAISQWAGLAADWTARLCRPQADLALIGTLKWLREDIGGFLARGDELEPVANILLPEDPHAASWSTALYGAAHLENELPLRKDLQAVVLDGGAATKYLPAIETPVVLAVLDRSVSDESAAEMVVQYMNNRGESLSVEHDVRWASPRGIEALGFWVPL